MSANQTNQANVYLFIYLPLCVDFSRKLSELHFRQRFALTAFRALQSMHIFTRNSRASASGNLAITVYHPCTYIYSKYPHKNL